MTYLSPVTGADCWTDEEPLECVSVVPEAPGVTSFTFRAPSGRMFDFRAGQFLTLEIPVPPETVHRTYTISSSPTRPNLISITAKAQTDSFGTRWMMHNLTPGMRIKAMGPSGQFTMADSRAEKFLLISAGVGVTPMMSMTMDLWDSGRTLDVVFINCARRPSELIFRQRLEEMASRAPGLDLKFVVSGPDPFSPWTGYQGRFNQLMLGLMAPDFLERQVYCCGPEPFMQSVREALAGFGFDMQGYHQESFVAPQQQAPVDLLADADQGEDPAIHFACSDRHYDCAPDETVLLAARAAGVTIPSGCTFGVCGSCKVRKLSGEVHMVHNGGILAEDIEAGYILACCSHPRGKISLDL
ncbi:2Fe-2S iron-sulfur cluster-binding protein [Paracoccus sp. Z330]|uniref:2Fe-2S iron-sulfur cluster-binding protein n=1 Tax=Paracoccus onchidii TaxID=3017813 RepID=A0ABT4ZED9_9RHOB|nr:hybrid-cluster NAD(P)-dependent oxidoreductase [Paracoccus onchidii]MDB6177711.1 2Fe-2S iron-sulfur cluster-binding protein [Paracoccus onchidii]